MGAPPQRRNIDACDFPLAFRRATGRTAEQYLTNVRVDRSLTMLATTDRCIPEIAASVGFADDERYERCFAARLGCSPETYRASRRV